MHVCFKEMCDVHYRITHNVKVVLKTLLHGRTPTFLYVDKGQWWIQDFEIEGAQTYIILKAIDE